MCAPSADFARAVAAFLADVPGPRARRRAAVEARFPVDSEERSRAVDLALDALESAPLAPVPHLAPPQRLPAAPVTALCFSAFPHIANEVYPLLVDACVAGASAVAVHRDWLRDGGFRRALWLDDDGGLTEADVLDAPPIARALALALDLRHERADHARLEAALPGAHWLNPTAGTDVLDDKAQTGHLWGQGGLPTPRMRRPGEPATALGETVIVKSRNGTEGRGVARVPAATVADDDPRLVMEVRGDVTVRGCPCALRLNVSWDGAPHAESGYAVVAGTPEGIASAGAGGRVIALADAWAALCRADGTPVAPTRADWQRLLALAEAGVAALHLGPATPALVGVDLLLDAAPDGLAPVLLEANGRPAGHGHARFVTPDGPGDEPGVSLRIWR